MMSYVITKVNNMNINILTLQNISNKQAGEEQG